MYILQEERPGPAVALPGADVPHAVQMPVAGAQQQMAAPRMPAAMPPRMAEPGPQVVPMRPSDPGVVRPSGSGDGLGAAAQAAAAGNEKVVTGFRM